MPGSHRPRLSETKDFPLLVFVTAFAVLNYEVILALYGNEVKG